METAKLIIAGIVTLLALYVVIKYKPPSSRWVIPRRAIDRPVETENKDG